MTVRLETQDLHSLDELVESFHRKAAYECTQGRYQEAAIYTTCAHRLSGRLDTIRSGRQPRADRASRRRSS